MDLPLASAADRVPRKAIAAGAISFSQGGSLLADSSGRLSGPEEGA